MKFPRFSDKLYQTEVKEKIAVNQESIIPNCDDKTSHHLMSGSPNLSTIIQQQPFVFKCLHKKSNIPNITQHPIYQSRIELN